MLPKTQDSFKAEWVQGMAQKMKFNSLLIVHFDKNDKVIMW